MTVEDVESQLNIAGVWPGHIVLLKQPIILFLNSYRLLIKFFGFLPIIPNNSNCEFVTKQNVQYTYM